MAAPWICSPIGDRCSTRREALGARDARLTARVLVFRSRNGQEALGCIDVVAASPVTHAPSSTSTAHGRRQAARLSVATKIRTMKRVTAVASEVESIARRW